MQPDWNDLRPKSFPEIRANLKHEAHRELQRIGFDKLCQARQKAIETSAPATSASKRSSPFRANSQEMKPGRHDDNPQGG
jgi:hypothetical protein